MSITQKVLAVFKCDLCGKIEEKKQAFNFSPDLCPNPKGWVRIKNKIICDKHKIFIDDIDIKEIEWKSK